MYKIKQVPEDFKVYEQLNLKIDNKGKYSYYKLWKKNYNTIDAIGKITRILKINPKYVNFAGTKDRNAITEQYISISMGPKTNIDIDDLKLTYIGRGSERINLGTLEGNYFEITIRNLSELDLKKFKMIDKIINFYDDQRFGINANNQVIGKAIIKKDFKTAIDLIDNDRLKEKISDHLSKYPNDLIGAFLKIPKKLISLYIHSYQSDIWNQMVRIIINFENSKDLINIKNKDIINNMNKDLNKKNNKKDLINNNKQKIIKFDDNNKDLNNNYNLINSDNLNINPNVSVEEIQKYIKTNQVPLLGFSTKKDKLIEYFIKKEDIDLRDFLIRQIPNLSSEGSQREIFVPVKDFISLDPENDELNPNMKKITVKFNLGKGSYATQVIKQLLKE